MRSIRWAAVVAAFVVWAGLMSPASAETKDAAAMRLPANYLLLPRMHFPVVVDANREYRELELEVWLVVKDEQNMILVRSAKKDVMAAVKDDFQAYDWEAFRDAAAGPKIAKRIVSAAVERVSGGKLEDVLIKALILH